MNRFIFFSPALLIKKVLDIEGRWLHLFAVAEKTKYAMKTDYARKENFNSK